MSLLSQNFKIWRWGCENLNIRFREASLFDAKYNDCMKSWRVESICRLFQNKPKENFRRLEFTVGGHISTDWKGNKYIYIFVFGLAWGKSRGITCGKCTENTREKSAMRTFRAFSAYSLCIEFEKGAILSKIPNIQKSKNLKKSKISKLSKILKNSKSFNNFKTLKIYKGSQFFKFSKKIKNFNFSKIHEDLLGKPSKKLWKSS